MDENDKEIEECVLCGEQLKENEIAICESCSQGHKREGLCP